MTLVCATVLTLSASAQITWNAKLGAGFSSCISSGDANLKSHFVGKAGVGIEYPLTANLSLMPSFEFAMKGAKEHEEEGSSWNYDAELNLNYLQVPIVAAYRINLSEDWNMTLKTGPYFAFALSGKMEIDAVENGKKYSESINIFSSSDLEKDNMKPGSRFDVGIDVGIDFEYHRFVIGAEYERGFVNSFPDGEDVAKVYNQAFYVTLGYKF